MYDHILDIFYEQENIFELLLLQSLVISLNMSTLMTESIIYAVKIGQLLLQCYVKLRNYLWLNFRDILNKCKLRKKVLCIYYLKDY